MVTKAQRWVAIYGEIDSSDNMVRHIPIPPDDASLSKSVPFTLARSNIEFESGTISGEVMLLDSESRFQFGIGGQHGTEIYGGFNVLGNAYGIGLFKNGQWETAAGAGFGNKPPLNEWIELRLEVLGSSIELFFNDVKVCSHTEKVQRGPVSMLFQSATEIKVKRIHIEPRAPTCFVVMQFTDEYDSLYRDVIKPVCERYGYEVIRADDSYTSGLLIEDITRSIRDSAVVIADITPDNPNVFYEVGYAHGIGKATILLSDRKRDRLPFDISGFRTVFYDNTIGGKGAVEESLSKHLGNINS